MYMMYEKTKIMLLVVLDGLVIYAEVIIHMKSNPITAFHATLMYAPTAHQK
jgi:predicted regulator of Ras-like GTPase activity (Roadblock/LC7/MglB family)